MEDGMVLGVDIGATKTQIGYIKEGRLVKSDAIKTDKNPDKFFMDLFSLIEDFLGGNARELSGLGIGAPGPLKPAGGIFGKLPNLPQWEGVSIKDRINARYNVPVFVQNDANVAALGEAVYGGGRGLKSVCYITISTGIGAGFVIDGRIIEGRNNLAGEIWALRVNNLGESDILLNACSGPGIVRNVKKLITNGASSSLNSLVVMEPIDVFTHAFINGDEVALKVMENAWENMAVAVEMILLILDPDIVLLGGGLCFDERYMVEPIREKVFERAFLPAYKNTPIKRSSLWNEAVVYGAVALAEHGVAGKI